MSGRFPGPMWGPGPGRFPEPGPMMGPDGRMMWQRCPQPRMMMGGPGGMWPPPGPGPMMGPPDGGHMQQGYPWMNAPYMEGGWGRFPHPGPPAGEPAFPFHGQTWAGGTDDPRTGDRRPDSPKASCSRTYRDGSPAGSDRSATSSPKKDHSRDYQEPDSSTSFEGRKYKLDEEVEEEEEEDYYIGPYCEVCELHLPSERMLWSHISGKRHLKILRAIAAGKPLPKKVQIRKVNPSSSSSKVEFSSIERAFSCLTKDEPVVGLGFVVETSSQTEELFTCELCDSRCNQNNMVLHVIGLKHRMNFLKKCDPERYARLKKTQKRSKLTEDVRQLCKESECGMGRGRPRFRGTQQDRDFSRLEKKELSPEQRKMALEDLRRILMQDFMSRNIDPDTVQEMIDERMELLKEYERRGVPFDLAKERVIEEEDRWSLLLEFERQTLSFDEAEERINYRMDLMKAYIVNDCPKEEARKKVLDDEVIRDFRKEFQRLGVQREQAQKQVEKRLWMLERLHYKGYSQEAASQKIMKIEKELGRLLRNAKEDGEKHRKVSEMFSWMKAGEDLENFIEHSFYELELSSAQREAHIKLALDALDRHRREKIKVDEAKKKVLTEDLQIPKDDSDEESLASEPDAPSPPEERATTSATPPAFCSAGTKDDITQRMKMFMTKLHALLEIDKQSQGTVDREKQLTVFDQLSQLELQSLLSDMNKVSLSAFEAKNRFVELFQQHEQLRKSLFPFTKESSSAERMNVIFTMFLQHYNLKKDEHSAHRQNSPSIKSRPYPDDSPISHRSRSRSLERRGHSSRRRKSRPKRSPSSNRSSPDYSLKRSRARSKSVDAQYRPLKSKWSESRSRSRSPFKISRSRSRSRSVNRHSKKGKKHGKRKVSKRSPSPWHKGRYSFKNRHQSSSPEYE